MADRRREDVERRIDELEETLEALRAELEPPRGPMGVPRPPRPREFLRFADEFAIPAAIAVLEANVRALELLRTGIRVSDPERAAEEAGRTVRDRAESARKATVEQLDRALSELERAMDGSGLPRNREARELLVEARRLNREIGERVTEAERDVREDAVRIEVESELESIRDEVSDEGGSADEDDGPIELDDSE